MGTVTTVLLITLLALNLYWEFLLIRMGYKVVATGKPQDTQNVVSKKDLVTDNKKF